MESQENAERESSPALRDKKTNKKNWLFIADLRRGGGEGGGGGFSPEWKTEQND